MKEKQIFASGARLCCTISMEEECVPKRTQAELVLNTPVTEFRQPPTASCTRVCDHATEKLVLCNETSKGQYQKYGGSVPCFEC